MPRKLAALGPKHHAAVRRKLGGASGAEIAEALGVQRRTVYLWMSDPLVKEAIARQLARAEEDVAARLAAAALVALEQLIDVLEQPLDRNPRPMEKLAVAREILDRYDALRAERQVFGLGRVLQDSDFGGVARVR